MVESEQIALSSFALPYPRAEITMRFMSSLMSLLFVTSRVYATQLSGVQAFMSPVTRSGRHSNPLLNTIHAKWSFISAGIFACDDTSLRRFSSRRSTASLPGNLIKVGDF